MGKEFICPHCGMDFNQPSVSQIVKLLRQDGRRDIYEIGNAKGEGLNLFTISYPGNQKMPTFSREIALAVEKTGIVYEFPNRGDGWFRRKERKFINDRSEEHTSE